MKVSGGSVAYDTTHAPVKARGHVLTEQELEAILRDQIAPKVRDDSGVSDVKAMLVGVTRTSFQTQALAAVLDSRETPKDWQIGEALAEALLEACQSCRFPWPTARDLRDLKASLPGTDLVGFQETGDVDRPVRFAFGEVKTSNDATVPPNVMYGRHGLKKQLEELRDLPEVRATLFLYLAFRAKGASWEATFKQAAARYLADSADVALYGILIRDTPPADGDLRARAEALARDCPHAMVITLLAFYLPANVIRTFVDRIEAIAEARRANN